jgi:hypothetical protein
LTKNGLGYILGHFLQTHPVTLCAACDPVSGHNGKGNFVPGLPDGLFSNQKFQFGKIFEGLRWEKMDIFYGHLGYFMTIWYILYEFGTFCMNLVHFSGFGIMDQ